jgi:DNA polymerase III subunit epsilon
MSKLLEYSTFHQVLFPPEVSNDSVQDLSLRRSLSFKVSPSDLVKDIPWVVFDFETTGLNKSSDRIIEIGALKMINGKVVDELSTLIEVDIPIPEVVQKITGITPDMLVGQPRIETYLPKLYDFIEGSVLIAHNGEFDMSFLSTESARIGFDINWPCFCTLKMARDLLSDLPKKNLDTLAEHYGLQFEARHRSIGDAKVTVDVLNQMLVDEGLHLKTWEDFKPYHV